jgi:glycosyltransferase involved in cell wall biosynthesis
MLKEPRIGFLTTTNPEDRRSWSGIHFAMLQELRNRYKDVVVLGPLDGGKPLQRGRIRNKISRILTGRGFDYAHSKALAEHYALQAEAKIAAVRPDILIAPSASTVVSRLKTDIPFILLSDTVFGNMVNYYPAYSQLTSNSLIQSRETENLAIQKARFAVFPSHWAADAAMEKHGANPTRVKMFPFGANFLQFPSTEKALKEKPKDRLRLLFLGVDWERKGGPLVLETFRLLRQQGISCTLTIVGVTPNLAPDPDITIIPFINKNDPQGEGKIQSLLLDHHFLFLPSKAECYGIVFCEAASCGTPSLTRRTGGIEGAVVHHQNGLVLPENATAEQFAAQLAQIWHHPTQYHMLCKSAYALYEQSHNWKAWGDKMEELIKLSLQR